MVIPETPDAQEELLASLLAAYDDSLASNGSPPPSQDEVAPALEPRLQEDVACLQLLQQLRPRRGGTPPTATDCPAAEAGERYTLSHLQAIGGIGEVWLAHDADLGREVALKELRPDRAADPSLGERFLREARITGQLQHPGIVPVYELVPGSGPEQQPYYTMRFVQGRTLTEAAQDYQAQRATDTASPSGLIALLQAFGSVCNTVAYAHSRGVIHRDLKGQNVVLGDFGEVIVLDWGFAKVLGSPPEEPQAPPVELPVPVASDQTMSGQVIGTPAYMAPEQAAGRGDQIDQRTDVYGLGAILYEILTGRPPFEGADTLEVLRKVREEEPLPPRLLYPRGPALLAICRKALARQPEDRYASAADLGRAVQQWLADEPVEAYREPRLARLGRWARRHKPIVAGVSALLATALVALGLGTVLIGSERARTAEARAQMEAQKAVVSNQIRRDLELHLYFQKIALAQREFAAHNFRRAAELLDECVPDLRAWEWHCLKRLCHGDSRTLQGHTAAVACVAFSPDGQRLASASHDNTIKIWDVGNGHEIQTLPGHGDAVYGIAYRPDGRHLASASWDKTVRVWDATTGRELQCLRGHEEAVQRVAYSPDGRLLVSLSQHKVRVWDAETGAAGRQLILTSLPMYSLAFSPDGQHLAVTHHDKTVRLWEVATGANVQSLQGHEELVKPVAFSPDGQFLATGAGDLVRDDPGEIKLWNLSTGAELLSLHGHTDPIYSVVFQPSGRRLVSASQDATIKVWDLTTGQDVLTLRGHGDTVRSLAFSPDGRRLASGSADGTIKIWDGLPWQEEKPVQEISSLLGHSDRVFHVVFSADGRRLASVGNDQVIHVWDVLAGEEIAAHHIPGHEVYAADFSPDGRFLVTATNDGNVLLLDALTGEVLRRFKGHAEGPIKGVAFSPDGGRVASASWERLVRVWEVSSEQQLHVLRGHTEPVIGVVFSADGRHLASASYDQTVKTWDATTGAEIYTLRGHTSRVLSLAFSPTGPYLASASNDGTVKLWDLTTGEASRTLREHAAGVYGVAFSRDGRRLATASADWTVKIWSVRTGAVLSTLRGHRDRVHSVAFHPDDQRLASAGYDQTIKLWDVSTIHPD